MLNLSLCEENRNREKKNISDKTNQMKLYKFSKKNKQNENEKEYETMLKLLMNDNPWSWIKIIGLRVR